MILSILNKITKFLKIEIIFWSAFALALAALIFRKLFKEDFKTFESLIYDLIGIGESERLLIIFALAFVYIVMKAKTQLTTHHGNE